MESARDGREGKRNMNHTVWDTVVWCVELNNENPTWSKQNSKTIESKLATLFSYLFLNLLRNPQEGHSARGTRGDQRGLSSWRKRQTRGCKWINHSNRLWSKNCRMERAPLSHLLALFTVTVEEGSVRTEKNNYHYLHRVINWDSESHFCHTPKILHPGGMGLRTSVVGNRRETQTNYKQK